MGGPDKKGLEGALLVQCHAPFGMASVAPVSHVTAKQAATTSPPFHPTESIKKCSSGVFLTLEMP